MINLIKKDMLLNFSNKPTNIMLLIFFPIILFVLGIKSVNLLFMFSTFSFAFLMNKINFVYETRDKSHIFTQSLPVTKRDIVISKYISVLANFILGAIYTLIYMWISKIMGLINVDKIDVSTILLTLGFTVVVQSISMPMQIRFPSRLSNFINMLIYITSINLILSVEDLFHQILNFNLNSIYNVLVIIGGIALVYFVTMGISISLYKTRKFY